MRPERAAFVALLLAASPAMAQVGITFGADAYDTPEEAMKHLHPVPADAATPRE